MPEFQRQVVIPNVQKCSLALLALARSAESELDLKILAIDTLTLLTTHHPSHHRALQQNMHDFTLGHLQGAFPLASSPSLLIDDDTPSLVSSAIRLHAALPVTGGKVGAGANWRKSIDSATGSIWGLVTALRKTYSDVTRPVTSTTTFSVQPLPDDPAIATPLALDRLRCMVRLLVQLLGTPTSRPVTIPLGSLVQLALTLIRCNDNQQLPSTHTSFEAAQRVTEASAIPEMCAAGCMLAQQLAQTCGQLFTSYVSQLFATITFQLEQKNTNQQRYHLLAIVPAILSKTHILAPSASHNRLAAQFLKVLSPLLPSTRTQVQTQAESKGKKRGRYEGDELFVSPSASSTTTPRGIYEAALSGLAALLPLLPLATQSVVQRTLLSLLLYLPRSDAQWLAGYVGSVYAGTLGDCASGMVGISVRALKGIEFTYNSTPTPRAMPHHVLQQFLHPRIPPNSGSGPTIDDIPLFWKGEEEDEEAKEFRLTAGIATAEEITPSNPNGAPKPPDHRATDGLGPENASEISNRNTPKPVPQLVEPPPAQYASSLSTAGQLAPAPVTPQPLPASSLPYATDTSLHMSSSVPVTPPATLEVVPTPTLFPSPGSSNMAPMAPAPPPSTSRPSSSRITTLDEDDDEPMPQIDLDSDSDDDET